MAGADEPKSQIAPIERETYSWMDAYAVENSDDEPSMTMWWGSHDVGASSFGKGKEVVVITSPYDED